MNWEALYKGANGNIPGMESLRKKALGWFNNRGFPALDDEDWRKTPIQAITQANFVLPSPDHLPISNVPIATLPGVKAVFVNGRYSPALSTFKRVPGVDFRPISEALKANDLQLQSLLDKSATRNGFDALNTAFMTDGAWIKIKKGTKLKDPIQLIYISSSGKEATASHIRNLIEAEESAEATILETYVGLCAGHYLTNATTQIFQGQNANVRHYKVQKEGIDGFHVGRTTVTLGNDSRYFSGAVQIGGAIVRNDIETILAKPGAECKLHGLFMASGKQVLDTHTYIDHASPHCKSSELYKGILNHKARGIFDGSILVRPDAQKTDSKQMSRNLLLSEDALIDTTPRLEIHADDVKCAHGATIGSLDADSIFYLRSRGMSESEARSLLTYAFAKEILDEFTFEPLKQLLDHDVRSILSGVIR